MSNFNVSCKTENYITDLIYHNTNQNDNVEILVWDINPRLCSDGLDISYNL